MTTFLIALGTVGVLLLIAAPGFLLIRRKMVSEDCIPGLSKVLMYVSQPCLAVYTFLSADFSVQKLGDIGVFALLTIAIHALVLGGSFLLLNRRSAEQVIYRILTIGSTFGNCAFFGIPVIEALIPDVASEVILFTTVYSVIMNVLGWTVGSAIITRDRKYISLRQIFINPSMLGTLVALLLFVLHVPLAEKLPNLFSMLTIVARMATPISMLVMGMRLGTMDLRKLFTDYRIYLTIAVKQILMPLAALLLVAFLPVDLALRQTFFIICACPVASIVLNFPEILGKGQKEAANLVLLGTILSILTLPLMMLLFPLIR